MCPHPTEFLPLHLMKYRGGGGDQIIKRSENLGPLSYLVFVKVEFMEMGTPVSNKYYIGSPRGEVYGLDHTLTRFADPEVMVNLRPQTDIPGLVLTGNDYKIILTITSN